MLTKSKNVSFLLLDFNEAPNSEIWIKESVWWRGFQFLNWGAFFARFNLAIIGAQHSESMTCRRLRRIYETSTAPTHSHHSSGAFLRCLSPESQFFPFYFNILWGCPFPWPSSALPTGPQISLGYDGCCCSCARKPPRKRSIAAVYQSERSVSLWLRQKNNETDISQLLANNNNNGHWRKEYCLIKSIRSGATELFYHGMTSLLLLGGRGGCQPVDGEDPVGTDREYDEELVSKLGWEAWERLPNLRRPCPRGMMMAITEGAFAALLPWTIAIVLFSTTCPPCVACLLRKRDTRNRPPGSSYNMTLVLVQETSQRKDKRK